MSSSREPVYVAELCNAGGGSDRVPAHGGGCRLAASGLSGLIAARLIDPRIVAFISFEMDWLEGVGGKARQKVMLVGWEGGRRKAWSGKQWCVALLALALFAKLRASRHSPSPPSFSRLLVCS